MSLLQRKDVGGNGAGGPGAQRAVGERSAGAAPAGTADVALPQQTAKPLQSSVSPALSPTPSVSPSSATVGGSSGSGKTVALVAGGTAVLVVVAVSLVGLRRIAGGERPGPQGPAGNDPAPGGASGGEVDG